MTSAVHKIVAWTGVIYYGKGFFRWIEGGTEGA